MSANKSPKTPAFANWLADQFIKETHLEEFFGDLQEIYQDRVSARGKFHAKLMYWIDVLHLLFGFSAINAMRNLNNPNIMFRHYFTIAGRNLSRNKVSSLINILGLAVGMGVCLLIYQYIHFEMSYDAFHSNAKNIYRVTQKEIRNGEHLGTEVYTSYGLGVQGKEEIAEIIEAVRICPMKWALVISNIKKDEIHLEGDGLYADQSFFQLFDFPLKYGDPESVLKSKYNIVIGEQMATKYFGDENPIGKVLNSSGGTLSGDFIITGVLKKLPINSHLQFDFLLPLEFILDQWPFYKSENGWENTDFVTYVKIDKTANLNHVGEKFDQLIHTMLGEGLAKVNIELKTGFQPITDIHLKSNYLKSDTASNNGNIQDVHVISVIAVFILLMAWVNYINLSTARAMHRAKEVGVRKTIGAIRVQLINQFIIESLLINIIAFLIAIGIAYLMLPMLNLVIGIDLSFAVLQNIAFWAWLTLIILLGSLLSGLYPAFVLSSFKPMSVFKSVNARRNGRFNLRSTLIGFQFLMSVLLISGTYLVYQQINYMKNKDLGIDMEKIVVLRGPRVVLETLEAEGATLESKYQVFKTRASEHHSVSDITATVTVPGEGYLFTEGFWRLGKQEDAIESSVVVADIDFTNTFDMEFIEGKPFSEELEGEDYWGIINEEAVRAIGFPSAEDALYEKLTNGGDTIEILGVVKNVHWNSLRDAHVPIFYVLNNQYGAFLSLKINLFDVQETIAHIEASYKEVFPDDPFHYFFLDDAFNSQYQSDMQFGKLFSVFALLAIFIACLGLFALVSYSTTLRIKEIGIRKVFGAGIGKLMILLSREYMMLLLIANVLALPVVIYWGKVWLNNYAFRIGIGIELLLIPGVMLVVVSLLTVSYRTYAAAKMNPVESLRSE